jgi:hypothetical protein
MSFGIILGHYGKFSNDTIYELVYIYHPNLV